jgi:hypothetical protein
LGAGLAVDLTLQLQERRGIPESHLGPAVQDALVSAPQDKACQVGGAGRSQPPRGTRPDGTDPDGFSAKVAAAYREYAPQTRAPALKIADEAGVPVATVRSWIREARRRGKLPQGRKGRAG